MTVFIHIGTTKTGTTSIQHTMYSNAALLRRDYSIHYPTVQANHWAIILPYVSDGRYKPLRNRPLRRIGSKERFKRLANAYASDLTQNAIRYKTHVISAEQLMITDRDAVDGLRGFFIGLGLETKIIVYVRHPAERISSLISQALRDGESDLKSFAFVDDVTPTVRAYAEIFGKENMIIRRFGERYFVNGDLIDDFTAVINGEPIGGMKKERLNESLSVPAIMLAEHSYAIAPLISGKRSGDEYLTRIAGPKFRAPRWMVEKAIEANREGMDYLASEFGLRYHEVDLSDFPEALIWEFPPEAMRSVAEILNEKSLKIEELNVKRNSRRLRRRIRDAIRRIIDR